MSFSKEQLLPGETLVAEVRQHPIVLFRPVLLNIISAAVLVGLSLAQEWWFIFLDVFPILYLLWELVTRRNRLYILTDRRLVKREGVFSVTSFDASLDKINHVFHEQTLLGRIWRFGTVGIESASERGATLFPYTPYPAKFKNQIVQQREEYKLAPELLKGGSTHSLTHLLEELASLRDREIITVSEFEEKKRSLLRRI